MKDEDVRESPQAHLHHALLKLLTVGTLPRIVRGQLESVTSTFLYLLKQHKSCICMSLPAMAGLYMNWLLLMNIHTEYIYARDNQV